MQIIYIAVLLVMVVLNLFLAFIIWQMVSITGKQVQMHITRELENSSAAFDLKVEEFKQLENEKKRLQNEISSLEGVVLSLKTSPFYAPRPISRELYVPTARYVDNEFFDNHKLVNEMMKEVDQKEIIDRIRSRYVYAGNRKDYDTACEILKFLDMETVYNLCTISAEEQYRVLSEALKGRAGEFLEIFAESLQEDEEFDVLNFRTYIREVRTEQDPRVYVRTGDRETEGLDWDKDLVHQYDSNISEGLKIIYQNKVFDFSIYRLRSKK